MDRDGWLAEGFWNGALPPIGYRIVEATKQRGHHTRKTLEIDPIQAESVRMIFRLAREGNGSSGPMGVKSLKAQKTAGFGVPGSVPRWRARHDSNSCRGFIAEILERFPKRLNRGFP
jgi:hypothetical protein